MSFGEMVKGIRIEQGKTLRQFCSENGLDPSNWSKIERSINPPPSSPETLSNWAAMLGVTEGGEAWEMFMDQAAIARREIPADLLNDEKILEKLPAFFRTIRGTEMNEESLREFIETVKDLHRADDA